MVSRPTPPVPPNTSTFLLLMPCPERGNQDHEGGTARIWVWPPVPPNASTFLQLMPCPEREEIRTFFFSFLYYSRA